jgi:hypothetical protein
MALVNAISSEYDSLQVLVGAAVLLSSAAAAAAAAAGVLKGDAGVCRRRMLLL